MFLQYIMSILYAFTSQKHLIIITLYSIFARVPHLMSELNYLRYNNDNRHFVFIINPISGTNRKISYEEIIKKEFQGISHQVVLTQHRGHATEIASQYINQSDINIVGVGGDGTINEIAQAVVNTNTKMGIIPSGSGNGFAGHTLNDTSLSNAIQILKGNKYALCDTLLINNQLCCNTSGIGLSAYVAKIFDQIGKRGLFSYVKLGLTEFAKFPVFDISIDNNIYKDKLLLEITNSSQLGNSAFISPDASVQDGIAELVLLDKPGFLQVPKLIFDVFQGSFKKNKLTEHHTTSSSIISLESENHLHIDGEYKGLVKEVSVKVQPRSLNFIC